MGINLGDPVFRGIYHGKRAHEDDLQDVVQRALEAGCEKMMVTGSDLKESAHAIELAEKYRRSTLPSPKGFITLSGSTAGLCYATVGVHPCSSEQLDKHPRGPEAALAELKKLAIKARDSGHAVAFGEIGLDYDRLFLAPKETQLRCFEAQLDLATELQMPLFLHSRTCSEDFEKLLKLRLDRLPRRGLVHSFTGTIEEMQSLVAMGFDIGVNGCSLKTEENISVVQEMPLERLQIETDGPWVSKCLLRRGDKQSTNIDSVR